MAIVNATQTINFISEYSENLFKTASNFDNEPVVNVTSGSMTSAYSEDYTFDGGKGAFLQPTSYKTTDIIFNFGSSLSFTAKNTGNHIFSLRLLNPNTTTMFFVPFVMRVKLWKNAVNTDEFVINSVSDLATYEKKWVTWAQSFQANTGDLIDFSFQIDADLSYPFNNISFWMDGLKLEFDDRFLGTPSIYAKPFDLLANKSCFAELNSLQTQTFTVGVPTPISFNNQNEIECISHSTTVNNSEITVNVAGVYKFGIELQFLRLAGGGVNVLNCWIQKDTGLGFVNVPNSNIKINIATSARTFVSPLTTTTRLSVGDKIRFMASTDDADIVLNYVSASGSIPATPSVILNIIKIGN